MPGGLAGQALERRKIGDDVRRLHLLVEALFLGQIAEAVAHLEGRGRGHGDAAARRLEDLQQHPNGGRLARPVRAQKPADRTRDQAETQVVHGRERAEHLGYMRQLRHGGRSQSLEFPDNTGIQTGMLRAPHDELNGENPCGSRAWLPVNSA